MTLARNTDAPVPAPTSASSMIAERARRVPPIDEVDVLTHLHRRQHRAEHAGRVRHRRAHEVRRAGRDPRHDVHHLGEQRAVAVHHPLGIARGARRVGEDAHRIGIRTSDGFRGHGRVDHGPRNTRHPRVRQLVVARRHHDVQLQIGELVGSRTVDDVEVVDVAEAIGGDVGPSAALPQDEAHLLRPVDVHDRHEHVAAQRESVEGNDGFAPVRQLERDRVTGLESGVGQGRDQAQRVGRGARRSVPRHGRVSDQTCTAASGAPRRLRSTSPPSVSSVHHPSARYRSRRAAGTVRTGHRPPSESGTRIPRTTCTTNREPH